MTPEEQQLFKDLRQNREEIARSLDQPSMRGFKASVTEKYSEEAHFVYELLQNSDDVEATKVKFRLTEKGLYYTHNGSIGFSISNVGTEEEDRQNRRLGHINAITSIGNSTKDSAKIGKFGVGFKAVFQYTDTPHIYDDRFWFKIESLIVPIVLDKDLPEHQQGETVFYFPFDKVGKTAKECYEEILKKLGNLVNPVLFLRNLQEVAIEWDNNQYSYHKKVMETKQQDSITIEKVRILQKIKQEVKSFQDLYIFTRKTEEHQYSIAYRIDPQADQVIHHKKRLAYCFFATKEVTNLKFYVQAPFLLTDSREGIKQGEQWNRDLINALAELTADSLPICRDLGLINDDFFHVLPIDPQDFTQDHLFAPIYHRVLNKLQSDRLLPISNGYIRKNNAYLGEGKKLIDLLSSTGKDKQITLTKLVKNNQARLVFTTVTKTSQSVLWNYIKDNLVQDLIESDKLAKQFTKDVLIEQEDAWIMELYQFFLERQSLWKTLETKEIVLLENGEIVAPFNTQGQPQAFLPGKVKFSFPLVKQSLVDHPQALKFLKHLGISEPKLKDEIERFVIPKYQDDRQNFGFNEELLKNDFEKILTFAWECTASEQESFIPRIKDLKFILKKGVKLGSKFSNDKSLLCAPNQLYIPDTDLKSYFEYSEEVQWFNASFYKEIWRKYGTEKVKDFLKKLGAEDKARLIAVEYNNREGNLKDLRNKHGYRWEVETEGVKDHNLDSLDYLFQNTLTKEQSLGLVRMLTKYQESDYNARYFCKNRRGKTRTHSFDALWIVKLRNNPWVFDRDNQLRKPIEINPNDLATEYQEIPETETLFSKLFPHQHQSQTQGSLADKISAQFPEFTDKEILAILTDYKKKQQTPTSSSTPEREFSSSEDSITKLTTRLAQGARRKIKESSLTQPEPPPEIEKEKDDLIPPSLDLGEQITKLKNELETKIAQLTKTEELNQIVADSEPYSFAWFKALLELEYGSIIDNQVKNNPIRVVFSQVEWEPDAKLLLLSGTNYIPPSIEDNGDLSITFNYHDRETQTILVEAVSPQKNLLKAKLKNPEQIKSLDLTRVQNAVIQVKNSNFILENLKSAFHQLPVSDDYNFQTNLTPQIKFIFGPPGTGKTTHLVTEEILPKIQQGNTRILVLTPTNKAADVLTEKVLKCDDQQEKLGEDNYLIRYGITQSNELEKTVFRKTRKLPLTVLDRVILVTTIARFTYDYFEIQEKKYELQDFPWDYIIFDEASMISLAEIVYVLHYVSTKQPNCQFIIGGDPFQLSPIVQVEIEGWKEGNIYTLVGLDQENSFQQPQTKPHNFEVVNLKKQYRSITQLGKIFSHFSYSGILEHDRPNTTIKPITINNLPLKPVTLITFKVSRFESIYKPRKIQGSPYQIYTAILTVELVKYITDNLDVDVTGNYRIGVICPYRIQQNIVDKLLLRIGINNQLEVLTGTVHGFQGDECDMIINLLNPPSTINKRVFLNQKNLLNVSISRARDYLLLLLPESSDDPSFDLTQLHHLQKMTKSIKSGEYQNFNSDEIERIIFGKSGAIEEFSFPTSHQNVNVYANPEQKYEIRYDEQAIDLQLRL